jgi:hypothetical protein
VSLSGAPAATLPTARATSSTAIGWNSIGETRTVSPSVAAAAMLSMNS